MTLKSFFILAGATVLSVAAAAATLTFDRGTPALAGAGERLFPGLDGAAAEIARVTLREGDFEAVIERRDGTFVDAASGYPVDTEMLQEIVGGLTLAEIAEAKTSDPARWGDLGLAAVDAEEGAGSEIVLADEAGDEIARVVVGERDYTLGGLTGGQYVRRGDEEATWLARARIVPPSRRSGLFDTRLFETEAGSIVRASLTPEEGEEIAFVLMGASLALENEPPVGRVERDSQIARIPRLFATLDFDDVRAAGEAGESGAALSAETEDGITITLTALEPDEEDDRTWVRIAVEGSGEAADGLRTRTEGFEFALQTSDAQVLGWTLDDLTEPAES